MAAYETNTGILPDTGVKMPSLNSFCNLALLINYIVLFYYQIPSILKDWKIGVQIVTQVGQKT